MKEVKQSVFLMMILALSTAFVDGNVEKEKIPADKKKSEVSYTMTHPLHEWTGISKEVNGVILYETSTDKIESVAVSILLSTFDSKNSNRDSHALEVLEAIKYPTVKLTSNNIDQNGKELTLRGNLIFHNVTRPVTITAVRSDDKKAITVEGTFLVNITDYQIEAPSLMGVKTKEEITLSFRIIFPHQR